MQQAMKQKTMDILSPSEPPSFRIENQNGQGQGLILCDHASPRVPQSLNNLGLADADLHRHIGWDIGAEAMSLYLSRQLDMPLVTATYSRLVVDLNRDPDYFECMPEVSDHVTVPANAGLTDFEKNQRLTEIFWPYQNEITRQLDLKGNAKTLILAVHSFTPEMDGFQRPWHLGVLWNEEEILAKAFISALRENNPELVIGENAPYSLKEDRMIGSTIWRHAEERQLPYLFVEFRQDLIDTPEKVKQWGDIFLKALETIVI
jgi:predicted N-formylglutamate amidohydrolase